MGHRILVVAALLAAMGGGRHAMGQGEVDPATDATLASLETEAGDLTPLYSPKKDRFALYVAHSVDRVTLTAAPSQPGATVTGAGEPLPLVVGRNMLPIVVTAPDGQTQRTYTVKVIREQPTLDWRRVLEHAPWPGRDSAGEIVHDGYMWLLGGYIPQVIGDIWRSRDGIEWQHVGDLPSESGVNIPPIDFVFDGKMWICNNAGEIFNSADGKQWNLVNASPPWARRYAPGGVVYDGKMWVMGGQRGSLYNDVWASADGVDWQCVTESAPWSPRQPFGNVVVKDGAMWLVGGGIAKYEPFRVYRDVWRSTDGEHWELVTDHAPWAGRIWSECVVYRNRIFLLGGFRATPVWENRADVWYSADGANWKQIKTDTQWSERHETSAYVHDGKLWVIAGNSWPLMNDVWSLRIEGMTFLSQPVIEEYTGARYEYRADADFNDSCQPVRYRLVDAPGWLQVDDATGVVSGIAPAAGDYDITLEAYDDAGQTARQSWTLHVGAW
jgi:hypothetical protein